MREVNWNNVKREAPKWFRDAKFGLFFHWGPYSVPAYQNEWYSRNMYCKGLEQNQYHEKTYGSLHDFGYKDFYDMLKGEKFDPDQWASLVKRSGAKYAGAVSEHADNFSMWDSAVNPINSMNYGPHRDIVGECTEAFRKQGIRTVATFHHQWLWGWFMSTDNAGTAVKIHLIRLILVDNLQHLIPPDFAKCFVRIAIRNIAICLKRQCRTVIFFIFRNIHICLIIR